MAAAIDASIFNLFNMHVCACVHAWTFLQARTQKGTNILKLGFNVSNLCTRPYLWVDVLFCDVFDGLVFLFTFVHFTAYCNQLRPLHGYFLFMWKPFENYVQLFISIDILPEKIVTTIKMSIFVIVKLDNNAL